LQFIYGGKKYIFISIFDERKAEWNGDFNGDTVDIAAGSCG